MTTLHLIRHGRASALEADYDQLQPLGELQSRLLGEHLAVRAQRFDSVYVGPLKRQLETLRLMRESAGPIGAAWPDAVVLEGLAEGPFEVLMRQHVRPRLPHDAALRAVAQRVRGATAPGERDTALGELFDYMVEAWRRGDVTAPELESAAVFDARVAATLEQIVQREGREVAVVTSNGVIGRLLQGAGVAPAQGSLRHRVYNTSVSLLELRAEGTVARGYNLTEHLREPQHLTTL